MKFLQTLIRTCLLLVAVLAVQSPFFTVQAQTTYLDSEGKVMASDDSRLVITIDESNDRVELQVAMLGEIRASTIQLTFLHQKAELILTDKNFGTSFNPGNVLTRDVVTLAPVFDDFRAFDWIADFYPREIGSTGKIPFVVEVATMSPLDTLKVPAKEVTQLFTIYFKKGNSGRDIQTSDLGFFCQETPILDGGSITTWLSSLWASRGQSVSYGQLGPAEGHTKVPELFTYRSASFSEADSVAGATRTDTSVDIYGTFNRNSSNLPPGNSMLVSNSNGSIAPNNGSLKNDLIQFHGFIYSEESANFVTGDFAEFLSIDGVEYLPGAADIAAGQFTVNGKTFFIVQKTTTSNTNSFVDYMVLDNLTGFGDYYAWSYILYTFENSNTFISVSDDPITFKTLPPFFCGGDGSFGDPFRICTAEQLAALADYVNAGNGAATAGVNYKLMNDLDLGGYANWTPIGNNNNSATFNAAYSFQGNFNGSGKVIKNLAIHTAGIYGGLFGYIYNAVIDSLGIENGSVEGFACAGGLAGIISTSVVSNCYAACNVQTTGTVAGGLVGISEGNSDISNCYATGSVNGRDYVGGLVGSSEGNSDISNCYATGSVNGNNNFIGGLVGDSYGNITNCYATGSVNGDRYVGGLVGYNRATIENCVAANESVIATSATTYIHRIAGNSLFTASLTNNYANEDMVMQSPLGTNVAVAEGLNTADGKEATMATLQSFAFYNTATNWDGGAAWDMDDDVNPAKIWRICQYGSLPYFQWQEGISCVRNDALIFDVTSGKFYLNSVAAANEYTGQAANWKWENDTLKLNGFEWETTAPSALRIVGGDIDMDITGTNSFTSVFDDAAAESNGIYFDDDTRTLRISGSGTLNVSAGNATNAGRVNIYGIRGNVTLNSGTLNVTTGNGTGNNVYVHGIYGNVTQNGGMMDVTAVNATGSIASYSYGIYGYVLTLNDGTLNATGVNYGISIESASGATVLITGGTVTATGNYGISADNILITGGTVTVTGNYGISTYSATVSITGGTVTAQGNTRAIGLSPFATLTLPDFYKWTKSANFDGTGSTTGTYPSTAFVNTENPKYVKIETVIIAPSSSSSYVVAYNANGGSGTLTDPLSPYLDGTSVTVLGAGNIAYANHTFTGWNTKPDGSGVSCNPGDVFTITGDITLYAQWQYQNPPYVLIQRLITVEPSENGRTESDMRYARTGLTVTLSILPDPGYMLNSIEILRTVYKAAPVPTPIPVTVSGEGNVRTFIMPPYEVTVRATFTQSTGVETQCIASLQAYVQDGVLYVNGLTAGEPWRVYNLVGKLVYQGIAKSETEKILLPVRGIYIVTNGKAVLKIIN